MLVSEEFRYEMPTKIEFGVGKIDNLAKYVDEVNGNKVLIVGDPGVLKAGIIEKIEMPLKKAEVLYHTFSDIGTEATIESVDQAYQLAEENQCDVVIGVGGGSSLDVAKSVGLLLGNGGDIRDYVGLDKVPSQAKPVIAIPTTAGTGSEITRFSVLSDKKAKAKLSVGSMFNCPTIALVDPALTITLPPHITAATGMDALTHALESFVNKETQPISEALSIEAMKLISRSLRLAVVQGENLQARKDMLLASTMAAMAFNTTRLGLAHSLAIPLGAKFNIPHGVVNAILLPEVMQFNLIGNTQKFIEIAKIFGEKVDGLSDLEAAEKAVAAIRKFNEDIGIKQNLADFNVTEEDLEEVAKEAMLSGNTAINPVKPTIEDFKDICRAVMD
ncbi:iron-containing alcohol dehydrogenase [Gracilibacillus salitolerans]|uniref:Iron-containing alcohol dehydrogenase n=1 Tax=Gracilibacillus salitolerans TaxID=2663022 RepID=A0A5Q2TQ03_9BACI|nr:iron-containing alcohol dehydrogenase [Gracilibacillus salitolerans]QGH36113.1 iron-containing alcohol dehydrogenase [Gracilibacillus salitolerans]